MKSIDRPLLIILLIIVFIGVLVFSSASLGILARNEAVFKSVLTNQLGLGLFLGLISMFVISNINYKFFKKFAFWGYVLSLILMFLVFIPGIGFEHGGAKRWIHVGDLFSFQPSEIHKFAFVIFFSMWLSQIKSKITTFKYGTLSLIIFIIISGLFILSQPDTATFGVITISALGMYLVAGAKWRDVIIMGLLGVFCVAILAFTRPYVMERIQTFINPHEDSTGSGYQIQQSMIAIGSGQILGKGFGQSVQKFNFLPEPIGDSIFAVASEEFGFVGSSIIILLYLALTLRAFKVASRVKDMFGRLIIVGVVIIIFVGSFINMASMLGLIPLSGIPLVFISHGGTSLFITLASMGIVLNISKNQIINK